MQKICRNKTFMKYDKFFIFKKPWTRLFKYAKNICKIFKAFREVFVLLPNNSFNFAICKIKGTLEIFFAKIKQSVSFSSKAFKSSNKMLKSIDRK